MATDGVIFGKQATEQLAKVVREHSRRVINETPQRPRWFGRQVASAGAGGSGAGNCTCGTQYSRGSVVLTWHSVDVEFATTYQTGWTDFPEMTHIGSGVWESATVTLDTCYGGIRSAKIQMTPIEPATMTAGDFDGDVIKFTAKIEVISVTNSCTGVDADLADITAKFYCDNFNNLATSAFELVAYHNTGDYQFPCTVCVSPQPRLMSGTGCLNIDSLPVLRVEVDTVMDFNTYCSGSPLLLDASETFEIDADCGWYVEHSPICSGSGTFTEELISFDYNTVLVLGQVAGVPSGDRYSYEGAPAASFSEFVISLTELRDGTIDKIQFAGTYETVSRNAGGLSWTTTTGSCVITITAAGP